MQNQWRIRASDTLMHLIWESNLLLTQTDCMYYKHNLFMHEKIMNTHFADIQIFKPTAYFMI